MVERRITGFAIVFKQVAHYTSNHGGKENEETI